MSITEGKLKTISENIWVVFTARIAMVATPFVASALIWLGSAWLETKFNSIAIPLQKIDDRVSNLENAVTNVNLKNAQQDIFVDQNKDAVTKIVGSLETLGSKINEINVNVGIIADREKRSNN